MKGHTPDEILKEVTEQEKKLSQGKLKIFFGAAPGVGKTYAMLEEAAKKRTEKLDVVIGIVETHGRAETEALLGSHEILPRLALEYRGKILYEFDLESAIRRRPALIVVDEIAHTNSPGMRHTKRWEDIKELLDRGIDVYTTLNVQHIESLNDVIQWVTGVRVRETIPDSAIDLADSLELIDLPSDELLKRLHDGKVYVPEQAELALQYFFRRETLEALRELALRFTAERVNVEAETKRQTQVGKKTWPVAEKLLVCVDHKPLSNRLIRVACRMANHLQADWYAVFIDSPKLMLTEHQKQKAMQNLGLAENLGAEIAILTGMDLVKELMRFSGSEHVTKIIIGKEIKPRWKELLFKSLTNEVIRASGKIDVYVVTGEETDSTAVPVAIDETSGITPWGAYSLSLATVAGATLISHLLFPSINLPNILLIYFFGIVFIGSRGFQGPSLLYSILSLVCFDYFFIPHFYGFIPVESQYLATLAIMFFVLLLIGQLTIFSKKQYETGKKEARRITALYRLTQKLSASRGIDQLLETGIQQIAEVFESKVQGLLPNMDGYIVESGQSAKDDFEFNAKERSIAQWVFDLGQMAGLGTDNLPFTKALYLPLQGANYKIGVIRIQPAHPQMLLTPEQMHLLQAFVRQLALAIEVEKLNESARKNALRSEAEGLRNRLLSVISNGLRAPLTSIQKLLKSLLREAAAFKSENPSIQLDDLYYYSDEINLLIKKISQTLDLESGIIELVKKPHNMLKIIQKALEELKTLINERTVSINIDPQCPEINCDGNLLKQVFFNLIENALQYSPPEMPVDIQVKTLDQELEVSIADRGNGILPEDVELIFEKFYRGRIPPETLGMGLGLSVARGIIRLHGGKIWAQAREGGGTLLKFSLPNQ